MVVDFVTVILQLGSGGEELTKINTGIGAAVVDPRVNQSLGPHVSIWQVNDWRAAYLVGRLECQAEGRVKILGLLLADAELQWIEQVNV